MKTLTFLTCLLLATNSFSQFLQTGLEWNYTNYPFNPAPWDTLPHIKTIAITGDTLIGGKTVYTIEGTCGCNFLPRHLYQEGQQMYYVYQDTFHLLYDFSLGQGDTLKIGTAFTDWMFKDIDTLSFLIDSVTYSPHIGNDTLKIQHITSLPAYDQGGHVGDYPQWGYQIIENVGSAYCLFPMTGLCEGGYSLRCLQLPSGEVINFTAGEGCLLNALASLADIELEIFPNPIAQYLRIENINWQKYDLSIIDLNGKAVYQSYNEYTEQKEIDTSSWPPGMYIVCLKAEDRMGYQKVVKL